MEPSNYLKRPAVNELEIRDYLARDDWQALSRVADWLAFDHHMSFEEVVGLFERLGGDRDLIEEQFFGDNEAVNHRGGEHHGRL